SGPKHIEFLDHLRGVAILAVLIFHTFGLAFGHYALPWRGWFRDFSVHSSFLYFLPIGMTAQAGVAIFFVVSGFCIHLSFETQGGRWGAFFVRRFFRIYPAYSLTLILSVLLLAINPGLNFSSGDFWRQLLSHVILIHNFSPATIFGFNAALWSLAVEAQLYLLYPLLLALVGRVGWRQALGILAAGELIIRGLDGSLQTMGATETLTGRFSWMLANSPFGYWFSWTLGAFVADSWLKKREPLPFGNSRPSLWLGLALGCHFAKPLYVFQFPLFAIATAALAGRCLAGQSPGFKWPAHSWSALQKIGLWSYSLYLLHEPLLHVYSHVIVWAVPTEYRPAPVGFLLLLGTWLAIIPLSALWYEVVEIPGIAWGRRISRSRALSADDAAKTAAPASAVANAQLGHRSAAANTLLIAALALGVAGSLFVSYQFSLRAALKRSHRAWVLATSPDPAQRDGALAVKLAEDACLQTQYRQPAMVGTLAAAYAEAGRFDEAIGAARMACTLASQAGDEPLLQKCQAMLKSYLRHEPFREPVAEKPP
ncbi:MAG TPA: acyltransferase family protein, partial [Candidatus Acidoferrales bacterium]|nr:acyltransferase family protein [Candidatus Acidoferrales bacterium]